MEDRRLFERINVKFPVKFLDPDNSSRKCDAEAVDISGTGIGFFTDENLALNTAIEMWMNIPDNLEPLYIRGQVMWVEVCEVDGKQRVGIYIENNDFLGFSRLMCLHNKN